MRFGARISVQHSSLKMVTVDFASVTRTLSDLVGINSISSRSNEEIINYAAARVQQLGMDVCLHPYQDEHGISKINLVATAAPGGMRATKNVELALIGHTDTVPFDSSWREALALTERDGKLYGRGACDTKGFIAAALAAIEQTRFADLKRPLALVLTADEEVGCVGAKKLVTERALSARYCIVGEPTSLQPIRAGKGYCLADFIVRGREGHSAYPHLGASAIFRAARLIERIERVAAQLRDDQHPAFDPPYTTVNVGLIRGGTAKNILAGECRFTLEWRPVPHQQTDRVIELIQSELVDLRAADASFECHIEILRLDGGMETRPASPLVALMEGATGKTAGAVAFGTEAPQMAELGAEVVVFGPGDIRAAHRTGEFVPIVELEQCVAVLKQAITHLCLSLEE